MYVCMDAWYIIKLCMYVCMYACMYVYIWCINTYDVYIWCIDMMYTYDIYIYIHVWYIIYTEIAMHRIRHFQASCERWLSIAWTWPGRNPAVGQKSTANLHKWSENWKMRSQGWITLWLTNITKENHHFYWENSLSMAIFNSYVSTRGYRLSGQNVAKWW